MLHPLSERQALTTGGKIALGPQDLTYGTGPQAAIFTFLFVSSHLNLFIQFNSFSSFPFSHSAGHAYARYYCGWSVNYIPFGRIQIYTGIEPKPLYTCISVYEI